MFVFAADEIAQIKSLMPGPDNAGGSWAAAYTQAADYADGQDGVDSAVIAWLRGAAQVNSGQGAYANFIRAYTTAQMAERGLTSSISLQEDSDRIALKVMGDIVQSGSIPALDTMAQEGAGIAAAYVRNGDLSPWSGCPLFVALGDTDPFTQNIVADPTKPYNAVAMLAAFENGPSALGSIVAGIDSVAGNGLVSWTSSTTPEHCEPATRAFPMRSGQSAFSITSPYIDGSHERRRQGKATQRLRQAPETEIHSSSL